MTFIKSILLSSVAGIVGVASVEAADLPTKKAAPAEYVRTCNVAGMAGFVIPGSDTCLKIGGYVLGGVEAGNLTKGYSWASATTGLGGPTGGVGLNGVRTPALLSSASNLRSSLGYTTRFNLSLDARQNTAYGVLRGYAEVQIDNGNGFANTGNLAYINLAYLQWAGLTAGKAPSFFSFFGGGYGYNNLFSPDQQGYNQPDLIAYTATLGGGFSATIAAQSSGAGSPGTNGGSLNGVPFGTNTNIDTQNLGMQAPDFVANVRVDQGWGSAQLSGVLHQVRVDETADGLGFKNNTWGWGVDGGVKINLPTLGAGDLFEIQGVYTQNALWYSGIPDGMFGELGAVNGNGLAMSVGDTYYGGTNAAGTPIWAKPTAWSVSGAFEHHFSPVFSIDPEAAYAELNWSGSAGQLSPNTQSFIVGAVAHWDPAPLLDFSFELLYQNTHQSTPGFWTNAAGANVGTIDGVTSAFKNNTDGASGRFYITRNF
jgi:hypothetical protein